MSEETKATDAGGGGWLGWVIGGLAAAITIGAIAAALLLRKPQEPERTSATPVGQLPAPPIESPREQNPLDRVLGVVGQGLSFVSQNQAALQGGIQAAGNLLGNLFGKR